MGDSRAGSTDGSLEFVGRIDSRVKVRGYTVDLEMVEAAIGDTGLVIDATVVAVEDAVHGTHLVAYVVPANRLPHWARYVRASPKRSRYMIPAHFVALDALPLTPNGQDRSRRASGTRGAQRPEATGAVAPRTALEASVCAIWSDVLEASMRSAIDDDFLEIGGDSLIAARIASRILAMFKVDLAPRRFVRCADHRAEWQRLIARRQGIAGDTKSR